MLSAVARSAARTLNAPIATASRNVYTLPLMLSTQRFYSVATEAIEHPDPSSTATKKTACPRRSSELVSKDRKEKEKLRAKKLADAEKAKAKAKAAAEKAKAAAEKEKAKLKAAAEREKLKAKKLAEKTKAKELAKAAADKAKLKAKRKENAPLAREEAALAEAASHLLVVPKVLASTAHAVYIADAISGPAARATVLSRFAEATKGWHEQDASVKAQYQARADANNVMNKAAFDEFIKSKKPIEIYNHNAAVRLLKAKGISKIIMTRRYKADKDAKYSEIVDPRVPKRPARPYVLYTGERARHRAEGEKLTDVIRKAAQDWKAMSEDEKKAYKDKSEAYHTQVYLPTMMELFGTTVPSDIAFYSASAKVAA